MPLIATPTALPEVLVLQPQVHGDARGFFLESFNQRDFERATGVQTQFVQDNHSLSRRGVLRGLHYQLQRPQGRLVRVVAGAVFDVAVDLRRSSATFGQWAGVLLSAENKRQLWIPPGFGHGFYTVSDWAEVVYKATDFYSPADERSIIWNDPDIGIQWPEQVKDCLIISNKDAQGLTLKEAEVFE